MQRCLRAAAAACLPIWRFARRVLLAVAVLVSLNRRIRACSGRRAVSLFVLAREPGPQLPGWLARLWFARVIARVMLFRSASL